MFDRSQSKPSICKKSGKSIMAWAEYVYIKYILFSKGFQVKKGENLGWWNPLNIDIQPFMDLVLSFCGIMNGVKQPVTPPFKNAFIVLIAILALLSTGWFGWPSSKPYYNTTGVDESGVKVYAGKIPIHDTYAYQQFKFS